MGASLTDSAPRAQGHRGRACKCGREDLANPAQLKERTKKTRLPRGAMFTSLHKSIVQSISWGATRPPSWTRSAFKKRFGIAATSSSQAVAEGTAQRQSGAMPFKQPRRPDDRRRSIVGSVVLALRVQEALPIVGFVRLFRVDVGQDLEVAAEEVLPHLENGHRHRTAHDRAND